MTGNSHQLPQTWAITSLAATATLINGDRGKNYPSKDKLAEKGFPFVNAGHIEGGRIKSEGMNFIDQKRFDLLNGGKFIPGDILFCIRGSLGKVAVNKNIEKGAIASSLIIVRPTPLVDGFFVFYYLSSPLAFDMIRRYDNGTAQPNLSGADLARFEFPLPSRSEQHRIVEKIETLSSELDKGIESLKTAREQLKVYRQTVLKHAFEGKLTAHWREQNKDKLETPGQLLARMEKERKASYQQQLQDWQVAVKAWEKNGKEGKKPGKPKIFIPPPLPGIEDASQLPSLPSGWEWLNLGSLVSGIDQGWSPKCENTPAADGEWGVIKTTAIQHGEFSGEENKALPKGVDSRVQHTLNVDDILITRAGPRARVGVCCLVRKVRGKLMNCDKAYRIRSIESFCLPGYLEAILNSPRILDEIERIKSGINDSGVNLNQGAFLRLEIPYCSVDEQKQIIMELDRTLSVLNKKHEIIEASLAQSEILRQSILKKAFSGQLVPQDPNDEPASALLARIQAEKTAHAMSKVSHKNSPAKGGRKARSKEAS